MTAEYPAQELQSRNTYSCPFVTRRAGILGLSRIEFCRLAGLSYHTVSGAEMGRSQKASATVMAALVKMGVDVSTLPQEYERWRNDKA